MNALHIGWKTMPWQNKAASHGSMKNTSTHYNSPFNSGFFFPLGHRRALWSRDPPLVIGEESPQSIISSLPTASPISISVFIFVFVFFLYLCFSSEHHIPTSDRFSDIHICPLKIFLTEKEVVFVRRQIRRKTNGEYPVTAVNNECKSHCPVRTVVARWL